MEVNKTITLTKKELDAINKVIELAEDLSDESILDCDVDEAMNHLTDFINDYHLYHYNDLSKCKLGSFSVKIEDEIEE